MTTHSPSSRTQENPLGWLLITGLLIWTLLATAAIQGGVLLAAWWSDLSKLDIRVDQLLRLSLLHPVLVIAPCLLLLLLRGQRQAMMVRTLLLTACTTLLLLAPRVLLAAEATYAAALGRVAISLAVGGALLGWALLRRRLQRPTASGLAQALVIGALFIWPWLRYGALGDPLDLALALLQAASLGVLAAGLASYLIPSLASTAPPGSGPGAASNVWLSGFLFSAVLALVASAWGQMDWQALLIAALPPLGFAFRQGRRFDAISAFLVVFLVAVGPLALADPRETRLIGLFSGDTALWSFRATTLNLITGWVWALLVGLTGGRLLTRLPAWVWAVVGGIGWPGVLAIYFLLGQPGFFGDDFFVVLRNQADLAPAAAIADIDARRAWVYETLVAEADATQGDLLSWLDAQGLSYKRYYLVNGVEVQGNAFWRWQAARRSDVARVLYSPNLRPLPFPPMPESGQESAPAEAAWGVEAIGAPRVWAEFGVTGQGIVIGQSDSGVDAAHPALAGSYRGGASGAPAPHDYNWFDPWTNSSAPFDSNGHGTHTLGTVVGSGGIGVAPGATWFACANLVRNLGNPAYYLDCMQFMLAPHPLGGDPLRDGRPDLAADVSTNSWGCPPALEGCDQLTLWQATTALRAAGIFFVAAAGNEGPGCESLRTPPGDYANVLSVGAVGSDGDLAEFSNRGPGSDLASDSVVAGNPDLLAPGVDVLSAWPGGGWQFASGTSMAAPHVAGVVALMWSANPNLRGDIDTTERILQETASPYAGAPDACGAPGEFPDSAAGYGVVDAYAAVYRALELR